MKRLQGKSKVNSIHQLFQSLIINFMSLMAIMFEIFTWSVHFIGLWLSASHFIVFLCSSFFPFLFLYNVLYIYQITGVACFLMDTAVLWLLPFKGPNRKPSCVRKRKRKNKQTYKITQTQELKEVLERKTSIIFIIINNCCVELYISTHTHKHQELQTRDIWLLCGGHKNNLDKHCFHREKTSSPTTYKLVCVVGLRVWFLHMHVSRSVKTWMGHAALADERKDEGMAATSVYPLCTVCSFSIPSSISPFFALWQILNTCKLWHLRLVLL